MQSHMYILVPRRSLETGRLVLHVVFYAHSLILLSKNVVARPPGFEPGPTVLETVMLPLHYGRGRSATPITRSESLSQTGFSEK